MDGLVLVAIAVTLLLVAPSSLGDITGTNPPAGTCLCMTTNAVNVRGTACGTVIGSVNSGQCFSYSGDKLGCSIGGTPYEFFKTDYLGQDGWMAGNFMDVGPDTSCDSPDLPTSEFRSLWIATVSNIDWPTSSSSSTAVQQQQMIAYLDIMQDLNMNALVFQIRPVGDAFYSSTLEPWSRYLTGTQGQAPSPFWDPLEFVISEAHNRNIEVHAWLNPYRANLTPNWNGLAANHMANTMREFAYPYGSYLWMDPGAIEVEDHLYNVVMDIMDRYDVDGIHFDDYFYPYPVSGTPFPDDVTYNRYIQGGGSLSRDDWRRDNINKMVERMYTSIKAVKRHVKFGISPFGIYRPGHPEGMPSPIAGFDPYSQIYADSKLWLQRGWLDYFTPQLYWAIAPPAQSYSTLLDWWLGVNPSQRHVYAGNGVYKMMDANNWPVSEITGQVDISRQWQSRLSLGNIHFSAKYFRDNDKDITNIFRSTVYPNPVTIPDMPWLDGKTPEVPNNVKVKDGIVTWDNVKAPNEGGDLESFDSVRSWAIYRINGQKRELLRLLNKDNVSVKLPEGIFAITALSRLSKESKAAIISVSPSGTYIG